MINKGFKRWNNLYKQQYASNYKLLALPNFKPQGQYYLHSQNQKVNSKSRSSVLSLISDQYLNYILSALSSVFSKTSRPADLIVYDKVLYHRLNISSYQMLATPSKLRYSFSSNKPSPLSNPVSIEKQKQIKTLKNMSEKLQKQKETIDRTTPRVFAILLILSTIPSFYFAHELFSNDYNTQQYLQNSNHSIKYFYVKNFIFYGTILTLCKMKYKNPSSRFIVERVPLKYVYVPLLLSFVGMMIPPTDSKHIIWPALLTDLLTMTVQLQMTNQGIMPFWFYSYKHYIRFFDLLILIIVYRSLRSYKLRRESHPHEFIKVTQSSESGIKVASGDGDDQGLKINN